MAFTADQLERLRMAIEDSDWSNNGVIDWPEKDHAVHFIASFLFENPDKARLIAIDALWKEMADLNQDGKITIDEVVEFFKKQP